MHKQDKNLLIGRLTADLLSRKVYTKVKRELLDLYNSRSDFYKKPRFDVTEQMARMSVRERKTYEPLAAVLSAYSDKFTVDEIKGHFFHLFFKNIFDSVEVNEEPDGVEFIFPAESDFAFLADVLSMGDYLVNLCDVDLLSEMGEHMDIFVQKEMKTTPPPEVIVKLKQFCFMRLKPVCEILQKKDERAGEDHSDKDLVTRFHPDTPFYDVCFYAMRALFEPGFVSSDEDLSVFAPRLRCDVTMNLESDHIIHSSLDRLRGNILSNADFRSDLRKTNQDEHRIDCLAMYVCMYSWLTHSMIGGQKYADDLRILEATSLTKQEIRKVIAATFLWADRNGITVPETVMSDPTLSSLLANDMVRGGFEMVLRKNRKDSVVLAQKQSDRDEKTAKKEESKGSAAKKSNGLERVLEENSKLKREEQQLRQDLKSKKDIEKRMKGEMSDMKKDLEAKIKKLKQELEKTKAENEELQKQLDDDEFVSDEERTITKEDVLSVAKGKKVLVWGIRPEIAERLSNEYPDIVNCIIMEDGRQSGGIPSGALDKCDAAIIVTNYSSHGMYYKARDEIKASGLPYAHARKNVNSPDRFGRLMWKVLTGIDNRNLKE